MVSLDAAYWIVEGLPPIASKLPAIDGVSASPSNPVKYNYYIKNDWYLSENALADLVVDDSDINVLVIHNSKQDPGS